jgi:hypothetical protein
MCISSLPAIINRNGHWKSFESALKDQRESHKISFEKLIHIKAKPSKLVQENELENDMHSCLSEQVNTHDTSGSIPALQSISGHFSIPREDHASKNEHMGFSSEASKKQGNLSIRRGFLIEIGHELQTNKIKFQ